MRIRTPSRKKGIALIIVLVVIAILAVLAGNFAASMKVETMLARNASFDSEFEWLGRSGIEAAKAILADQKEPFTSLGQYWAGGSGSTNGSFAEFDLHHFPIGDSGKFVDITIEDQERYFNINMADDMVLGQALNLIGVDAAQRSSIIDSIMDWKDADDNNRMSGAETSDYKSYWLPHAAKNGYIDDMSELLLVHGIMEQPQIFSRAYANPGASAISRHNRMGASKFEEVAYETTLTDLFTALSSRTVNINTCSAKVLQLLLPEIDEAMANSIIQGRDGPDGVPGTDDDGYRSVGQMMSRMAIGPPGAGGAPPPGGGSPGMNVLTRYCGVQSYVFKVSVKVDLGGMTRTYHAILRRASARDIQMLCMDWD
jgi:type II secretory pathway component PulK